MNANRTLRPIPIAWLMRHADLEDEAPCLAGEAPTLTANDIKDGWELTPQDFADSRPVSCPACGHRMVLDEGESMTRDHPGDAPAWFCADCGMTAEPARAIVSGEAGETCTQGSTREAGKSAVPKARAMKGNP